MPSPPSQPCEAVKKSQKGRIHPACRVEDSGRGTPWRAPTTIFSHLLPAGTQQRRVVLSKKLTSFCYLSLETAFMLMRPGGLPCRGFCLLEPQKANRKLR
jgi:hypothetical protein